MLFFVVFNGQKYRWKNKQKVFAKYLPFKKIKALHAIQHQPTQQRLLFSHIRFQLHTTTITITHIFAASTVNGIFAFIKFHTKYFRTNHGSIYHTQKRATTIQYVWLRLLRFNHYYWCLVSFASHPNESSSLSVCSSICQLATSSYLLFICCHRIA